MTRDELLALAREAGFVTGSIDRKIDLVVPAGKGCVVELEKFAQLLEARLAGAVCDVCGGTGTVMATLHAPGGLSGQVHTKCPKCGAGETS